MAGPADDDRRLAKIVAYVITTMWAISFLVDILNPDYDPPSSVHPLMLLVAGGAFGEGIVRANKKDKD